MLLSINISAMISEMRRNTAKGVVSSRPLPSASELEAPLDKGSQHKGKKPDGQVSGKQAGKRTRGSKDEVTGSEAARKKKRKFSGN